MNAIRKLFIDSRARSSGYHNNFTVELPSDVDTTRTTSVYLASCSFSNTCQSIIAGVNQNFYFIMRRGPDTFGIAYAVPAGQYSGTSLAGALQKLLDDTQGPLSTTVTIEAQGQLTFAAWVTLRWRSMMPCMASGL